MKLNWIFKKCILKPPNFNRTFIKFMIKLRNCKWVFSYMWRNFQLHVTALNFSYPKRKIIPITSFRISRETYTEYLTFCNWKIKFLFINLLKSNWIFWKFVLRGSSTFAVWKNRFFFFFAYFECRCYKEHAIWGIFCNTLSYVGIAD